LRIKNLTDDDYKGYQCRDSGDSVFKDFKLRGDLKVTRKIDRDIIRSIVVTEGTTLDLFCNYTGLNPEKSISDISFLNVTFYKDEKDITEDLYKKEGIFVNFTGDPSSNIFSGSATAAHRGKYKCAVNLRDASSLIKHVFASKNAYPLEFYFSVRVRDVNHWMLPGGILLVEVLAMAIFTAVIWHREEKKDNEDEVVEPVDSDDDDDKNTKL